MPFNLEIFYFFDKTDVVALVTIITTIMVIFLSGNFTFLLNKNTLFLYKYVLRHLLIPKALSADIQNCFILHYGF